MTLAAPGGGASPDLDRVTLEKIFADRVVPLLRDMQAAPAAWPEVVLLGGQPGAGKTTSTRRFAELLADRGGLVDVSIDDLRRFHPRYEEFLHDDTKMAAATRPAAMWWQERAAQWLRDNRYNVLLEVGFRDPAGVLATAEAFAKAGYQVRLAALAVPAAVSRVGIIERYAEQRRRFGAGRWTTMASHDSDFAGCTSMLAAADGSPLIHRVTVLDRSGVLFDEAARPGTLLRASDVLVSARSAPRDTDVGQLRSDLAEALAFLEHDGGLTQPVREMAAVAERDLDALAGDPVRPAAGGGSGTVTSAAYPTGFQLPRSSEVSAAAPALRRGAELDRGPEVGP
jgi:hypothetical protein